MKKLYLLSLTTILCVGIAGAQNIGIGTTSPNTSAQLDITSTSRGLLIPRMTTAAMNSIANPAKGLLVYDSVKNLLMVNMGAPAKPDWQATTNVSGWSLTGNSGTTKEFIGTIDSATLNFRVNNIQAGSMDPLGNIFWGLRAGQGNSSGYSNIAIGTDALKANTIQTGQVAIGDSVLLNTNGGTDNVGIGYKTMLSNTVGSQNVAVGRAALLDNTTGSGNTAIGWQAMYNNTIGLSNTAVGAGALQSNSGGYNNIGMGSNALLNNTTGSGNTALGTFVMADNGAGSYNTAVGEGSLIGSTTGNNNSSLGYETLYNNGSGSSNVAIGYQALYNNSDSYNVAVGQYALYNTAMSEFNTAIGYNAGGGTNQGYNNVFLGANTGTTGDGFYNCIAIGQDVYCSGNSQVRIGNPATVSIGGNVSWTTLSDGRVKKDINENVKGLDFIMRLRPVTYRLDINALQQRLPHPAGIAIQVSSRPIPNTNDNRVFTGFVAQEVEQASKASGYDFAGVDKPQSENGLYGLRYSDFVAPLVKSVQELNTIVTKQQAVIDELQRKIAELGKTKNTDPVNWSR